MLRQTPRTFRRENRRRYTLVVAFAFLARAQSVVVVWLGLYLLGLKLTPAEVALMHATRELMIYVLALLPTRLGTTEASHWGLFKLLGYGPDMGVVFQLLMRLMGIIVNGGGLLIMLAVGRRTR